MIFLFREGLNKTHFLNILKQNKKQFRKHIYNGDISINETDMFACTKTLYSFQLILQENLNMFKY